MNDTMVSAMHEAGHACAATLLLSGVVQVDVGEDKKYRGQLGLGHVELIPFEMNKQNALFYFVVIVSGWTAHCLTGKNPIVLGTPDWLGLQEVAAKVGWDNEEKFGRAMSAAVMYAQGIVEEYRTAIETVANVLEQKKILTGDEIRRLMQN